METATKYLLATTLFLTLHSALAQDLSISGIVRDAKEQTTFPGATIMVTNPQDTSLIKGGTSDFDGQFSISGLLKGDYLIKVNFVGFKTFYKSISLKANVDLGPLDLTENTEVLAAVEIVGKAVAAMQKGDTSQFSAMAYQTAPDASSQALIEKLPGISTVDGKIQANGEDVQIILLDGKPFFTGDVNAALQNLPAEMVASIQIFDKKSDQAQLSGFDDGQQQKTINIITKPNRKVGQFGKSTVGIGTDKSYQTAASINFFNDDQRITVTGLSNNTNLVRYTANPNDLGDSRQQNGLIKTNNLGINFSDNLGDKFEINGNYQFTRQQNQESTSLLRDYALNSDSSQLYSETSNANNLNSRHNINMKLEYDINDNNVLLMRPNISFRHEDLNNQFNGNTQSLNNPINETDNKSEAFKKDYDYNNNLFYNRKFQKSGRNLTARLHTGWHWNEDNSSRNATNVFYEDETRTSIINQETNRLRTGISWETQISYTEPIGENGLVELEYEIGDRINDSDQLTFEIDETNTTLDTALSNTFENSYLTQQVELGYQHQFERLKLQFETEYQRARLKNDQGFPMADQQNVVFRSWLPSARFDFKMNESSRLLLTYRTSTNEPSTSDLQNVIDASNPLQLRSGNSDLKQTYSHGFRARYWLNNMESGKSLFATIRSDISSNLITNSTFLATQETEISDGVVLERGSRLTKPVNLNGYYHIGSYVSYGQPLDIIKSNIRFNGGIGHSRRPGQVNDAINFSNNTNYRLGASLSSNISEKVDFNISTRSSYNVIENSINSNSNQNYYNQTTNVEYRWIFLGDFVYRMDMRHQTNSGLSAGFDTSYTLLNMSLGKKFLKNNLGEISLNVYDLLEQNNNAQRNVNELYVEDRQSTVLERFFMLTFTYNIRHFNAGTTMEDFEDI